MGEHRIIITDAELSSELFRKPPLNTSRGLNILKGAVGLIGLTSILYGIGFLVLRSHYAFLGFWGGVPVSSSEVAEEGGRFLFDLIYLPITLLSSITKFSRDQFLILAVVVLLWDLRNPAQRRLGRVAVVFGTHLRKFRGGVERLLTLMRTLGLFLLLAGSVVLLETLWQVVEIRDVLRTPTYTYRVLNLQNSQARTAMYTDVVWRVVIVTIVVWLAGVRSWHRLGRVQKFLVMANGLVLLAAIASVPVIYGKLMMPTTYRTFSPSENSSESNFVLITYTPNTWVVWDSKNKVTKLLPRNERDLVSIGSHVDLSAK